MNILIADDHPLIVSGFVDFLQKHQPSYTYFQATHKQQLDQILASNHIDIVFQDVRFGKADARQFIPQIKKQYPSLKIIILTSLDDNDTIQRLFAQGVDGFILKTDDKHQVLTGLEKVSNGERFVSTELNKKLITHLTHPTTTTTIRLTPREQQVLDLIVSGQSTKEIAQQLFLSPKTVEGFRANLFAKFDVKNVAGLVREAIRQGYTNVS